MLIAFLFLRKVPAGKDLANSENDMIVKQRI